MATRTGIPRVGVETYNTNIKSPGINRHTTYTKGEVEEIGDFAKMNKAIQDSIDDASKSLGRFLQIEKERTTIDPEIAKELGLDPESTYGRRDYINAMKMKGMSGKEARQAWRNSKKNIRPVDDDDADPEEKAQIVNETANEIGEKAENSYQKAAEDILGGKNFNSLSRRQKILAKRNLQTLAKSKQNITTLMSEWAGADPDDIDLEKYSQHPEVRDFMQYILNGDGAKQAKETGVPYTFSNENGGTILYGDGKKLLMTDLEAGKHIYATADNTQLKKDVAETTKNNVATLLKAEDKIIKALNDQSTKPEDPAYSYNREQNIRDFITAEFTEDMYKEVWNAEMRRRFENGRYVNYDPVKHKQLVQDYLYEQYDNKMGEQSPLLVADKENIQLREVEAVEDGKVRVQTVGGQGYKDVDAALYDRIRSSVLPFIVELTEVKSDVVFSKDNPLPNISDSDFSDIETKISEYEADQKKPVEKREGKEPPTDASVNLIDTISATRGVWSRVFDSAEDVLNAAINKANKIKQNPDGDDKLSADEQKIVDAYLEYKGVADNMVDIPDSNFDKSKKVTNAQLNKSDGTVRLFINGKSDTFNLKDPQAQEQFMALVTGRTGTDMDDATFILRQFLRQLNINFDNKPALPGAEK